MPVSAPTTPRPASSSLSIVWASLMRVGRAPESTCPAAVPSIGIREPTARLSTWPALAATTSSVPSASSSTSERAPISARPRLTISSSTRSTSVSAPIARTIAVVASNPCTARSSSSLRVWTPCEEPGVVDRDPGPARQDGRRLLVGDRELRRVLLLGQIQLAPRLAADHDRHAEDAASRAAGRRSPRGARR